MNLKFAVGFVIYWLLLAAFYTFGSQYLTGVTVNNQNDYNVTVGYTPGNISNPGFYAYAGGGLTQLWNTLLFVFFGLGLPASTPAFMQILLALIQTAVSTIGILVIFGT